MPSANYQTFYKKAIQEKTGYVTKEGDRFGQDGWRVGTIGTAATGSALEEALGNSEKAIAAVRRLEKTQSECRRTRKDAESALENCRNRLLETQRDHGEIKDAYSRTLSCLLYTSPSPRDS